MRILDGQAVRDQDKELGARRLARGWTVLPLGWFAVLGSFAMLGADTARAECSRVVGSRWDAGLRRQWLLKQACGHPERPAMLVAAEGQQPAVSALGGAAKPGLLTPTNFVAAKVVQVGELVRLWTIDGPARTEMRAVAEQGGALGERIGLRLEHSGFSEGPNGSSGAAGFTVQLRGRVRGAGDVELER